MAVNGAKAFSITRGAAFSVAVIVAPLNAFLVDKSTGFVKRVLYIMYKPLFKEPSPFGFGVMVKLFLSTTLTSLAAKGGCGSPSLFHSLK